MLGHCNWGLIFQDFLPFKFQKANILHFLGLIYRPFSVYSIFNGLVWFWSLVGFRIQIWMTTKKWLGFKIQISGVHIQIRIWFESDLNPVYQFIMEFYFGMRLETLIRFWIWGKIVGFDLDLSSLTGFGFARMVDLHTADSDFVIKVPSTSIAYTQTPLWDRLISH